jgi:DNA-binding transcriptional LysR family regulator
VTLFVRHSRGLIADRGGQRVLEMIRPLLALQDKTWRHEPVMAQIEVNLCAWDAFEQGIFAALSLR